MIYFIITLFFFLYEFSLKTLRYYKFKIHIDENVFLNCFFSWRGSWNLNPSIFPSIIPQVKTYRVPSNSKFWLRQWLYEFNSLYFELDAIIRYLYCKSVAAIPFIYYKYIIKKKIKKIQYISHRRDRHNFYGH